MPLIGWALGGMTAGILADEAQTHHTDGIDLRVINVAFGWWFPERNDTEHGVRQSNVRRRLDHSAFDTTSPAPTRAAAHAPGS